MLGLRNTSSGIELDVHVQPGARRNALVGMHADRLKVAIKAPPVEGRANQALTHFLADVLGVPRSQVTVRRGTSGRDKTLAIAGITSEELTEIVELEIPSTN
jgi:uncharacterized protein (TIGR00251 family)